MHWFILRPDDELKNKVRFSAPRTEAVIKQLVNTWWLAKSDDKKKVLIGPRSYVDLRTYLEDAAEVSRVLCTRTYLEDSA